MRTQTFTAAKPSPPTAGPLARAMRTPRDYREGKTLLADLPNFAGQIHPQVSQLVFVPPTSLHQPVCGHEKRLGLPVAG